MTKIQIEKKIASLEFANDQMEAELQYIDDLLRSVGFPRGLASVKEVALELLESEKESHQENENKQ